MIIFHVPQQPGQRSLTMITFDSRRFKNGHDMGTNPWGPQQLSLPQAIVKLLTFGLTPGDITEITDTRITTTGGVMSDVDISTFDGDQQEIQKLLIAAQNLAGIRGTTLRGEHHQWNHTWPNDNHRFADISAKAALLQALSNSVREITMNGVEGLFPYDIDDLADALDIVMNDSSYTLEMLKGAMFEIAPHKRMR